MKVIRWAILSIACAGACGDFAHGQIRIADIPAETQPGAPLEWQGSLDTALETSKRTNQPIVVVFAAPWCEWCRKENEEFKTAKVQGKLKDFARVHLDFDNNRELARKYGVGPIPAIRILQADGRVVGLQDGFMRAERLVTLLDEAQQAAKTADIGLLLTEDAPSAETIKQIIALFGHPQAEAREGAIRRLLPYPAQAARPVAEAFANGTLAVRLSALDLLEAWKAPVDKLDPWRPETLTKDRLEALKAWASNPEKTVASATQPALDERQLADARQLIERLLSSADSGTAAIYERLARYGRPLLPTVYAMLKSPPTDAARERLTLLRYRLAASDALAMQWPTGLDRLASGKVKVRHSALEELSKRATPRDVPLLLELFSDSDPLVRETALRLLQKVGGAGATEGLAQLLHDPDPNVRAAVLKSVEEQPSPTLTAKIAEYAAGETDADLLVHAARVLRKGKGDKSYAALNKLLDHENWRVRAEAAEAMTEMVGSSNSSISAETKADIFVRLSGLLDDPDGFVASKAMLGLKRAEIVPDLQKVAQAARKHPQLAADAVRLLAAPMRDNKAPAKASVALIREFVSHKDPEIRAVAVSELVGAVGESASEDVKTAMRDPEPVVRIAATKALFAQLEAGYPSEEDISYSSSRGKATELDVGNAKFLAGPPGRARPAWIHALRPELEKALESTAKGERVRAALCLLALGYREKPLQVAKEAVKADATQIATVASALKWLPWEERAALLEFLLPSAGSDDLTTLARGICAGNDPRAAERVWGIMEHPKMTASQLSQMTTYLRRIIFGSEYRSVELPPDLKKLAAEALEKKVMLGNGLQKVAALALLPSASPEAAADLATRIRADEKAPADLKRDAFQIQLVLLKGGEAQAHAAAELTGKNEAERQLAMDFLIGGNDAIRYLRDSIYLNVSYSSESYRSGQPIVPLAPRGVTVEMLKPMLKDRNPRMAACAGYLLALLHDRSGLDRLMAYYRSAPNDSTSRKMVYRAVTALDDDSLTPTLSTIYHNMSKNDWEMREFYWTIRSMNGEKVMELRKEIRATVGMENLR